MNESQTQIEIVSFGFGHAPAPESHVLLDLRTHFRDPHIDPRLRHLTAHDPEVGDRVLNTPGVRAALLGVATTVLGMAGGPGKGTPVTVAVGCVGGRHRAPRAAIALQGLLAALGLAATLTHRDLDQDVLER